MARADFSDLKTRVISAVIMLAIAGVSLWLGGSAFKALLILVSALMAWEISRMHDNRSMLAIISAIAIGLATWLAFNDFGLPFKIIVLLQILMPIALCTIHQKSKLTVMITFLVLVFATSALGNFRLEQGLLLTLWLLLCIIASDVGGYFAGKFFGGPKLWVRISPKKTWSGTLGGWVLAAAVGVIFVLLTGKSIWLILASIFVAIAAQSGDLVESAIKRRAEIKDSSNLIPGHGGLLDRFDGVLGVCLLLFLVGLVGII